jgi:hypothetical protein
MYFEIQWMPKHSDAVEKAYKKNVGKSLFLFQKRKAPKK